MVFLGSDPFPDFKKGSNNPLPRITYYIQSDILPCMLDATINATQERPLCIYIITPIKQTHKYTLLDSSQWPAVSHAKGDTHRMQKTHLV